MWGSQININVLVGKTLSKIDGNEHSEEMIFHTEDGEKYKMYYEQD